MPSHTRIHFGAFALDVSTGELWQGAQKCRLPPKPMRVLELLANSPGQLVTRETLRQKIWGADTFVDFEHGLNFCIRIIRSVLGDDARHPLYIETLPRRGYRFIASATTPEPISPQPAPVSDAQQLAAAEHYARARQSFSKLGKDSLEAALHDFDEALRLNPEYSLAHSGLGATYALRITNRRAPEDLEKSLHHLQRALALDPELAEPYPWLCFVLMRLNRVPEALQAGHRAVELQPNLVHAHYFLGLAYFAHAALDPEQYQNAVTHLLQATRVSPHWQASWFVLASAALLTGDYQHAAQFANRLVEMRPSAVGVPFIGAELILASIHMRRRESTLARGVLNDFLEYLATSTHMYRDTMSAVAACLLGDLDLSEHQVSNALAAYRRAWHTIQEHPRVVAYFRIAARAQVGLAAAYIVEGDRERGEGLLQKALQLLDQGKSPDHNSAGANLSELYYSFATASLHFQNFPAAIEYLRNAVDAGWHDYAWLAQDPCFASLHEHPSFQELLAQLANKPKISFA